MPNTERRVRPTSAESRGEAPGRGRLGGRRILVGRDICSIQTRRTW